MQVLKYLPALVSVQLILASCAMSPPLSIEPYQAQLQTNLPSLNPLDDLRIFSFRLITPAENVDIFSILQATDPVTPNQNTLPVGQLKSIQVAKEKITSGGFLKPEEATVIAFDVASRFNWDKELARQVLVEVVHIYTRHRDAEVKKFREAAEARAQFFIEKNRIATEEYKRQSNAVIEEYFGEIPNPQPVSLEVQRKRRELYAQEMKYRYERNQKAQAEYQKQAKAALAVYLKDLDEQTRKAREKEKRAQEVRRMQFDAILAKQKGGLTSPTDFALLNENKSPYNLMALTNGNFMLESSNKLPAVIQLQVDSFALPIAIPVLPQTSHGRLLVSINKDTQGRPVVYGGMESENGERFDLNEVLFKVEYDAQGQQQVSFIYPTGRIDQLKVSDLEVLDSDTALNSLLPQTSQLDAAALELQRQPFAQVHYQALPELSYLDPGQAAEVLQDISKSL